MSNLQDKRTGERENLLWIFWKNIFCFWNDFNWCIIKSFDHKMKIHIIGTFYFTTFGNNSSMFWIEKRRFFMIPMKCLTKIFIVIWENIFYSNNEIILSLNEILIIKILHEHLLKNNKYQSSFYDKLSDKHFSVTNQFLFKDNFFVFFSWKERNQTSHHSTYWILYSLSSIEFFIESKNQQFQSIIENLITFKMIFEINR